MEVTFGLDHVVIRVDDLAVATVDYTTLGFTVVRGVNIRTGQAITRSSPSPMAATWS